MVYKTPHFIYEALLYFLCHSFLIGPLPLSLSQLQAPPLLCCCPIAPHESISVCHTRDGTVLPGIVINGRNSAWKIPLSGCQLAYAEKKLITAVSWADGAGRGVSDCTCVCVCACTRDREREKPIFVHVSKCMHVCPPLLCTSHHAWISVSTCFKLSVKVTACPRAGIQVTWIISQKWRSPIPSAPCTHNRSNLSFLMNNLCAPCCFMTTVILLYSMVHMFGTYAFCLPISTHSHPPFTDKLALTCAEVNMAGGGDITPIYQFYVKANSC